MDFQYIRNRFLFKDFLKIRLVTTALRGTKFYEIPQTADDLMNYIKQKDS